MVKRLGKVPSPWSSAFGITDREQGQLTLSAPCDPFAKSAGENLPEKYRRAKSRPAKLKSVGKRLRQKEVGFNSCNQRNPEE